MTTSYLLIHDADIIDSGIYVCAPTSGGRTSIKVHVFLHGKIDLFIHDISTNKYKLNVHSHNYCFFFSKIGERPEAMQTGTSTYIANNIMQTILIGIIISTYNVFQNYYSTIFISSLLAIDST